jgi:hypothetical protein
VGELPGESVCGSRNAERGGKTKHEEEDEFSVARRAIR